MPFELLFTAKNSQLSYDYKKLPYLLRDHSISYGYSAKFLFDPFLKTRSNTNGISWIGFAPTYPNNEEMFVTDDGGNLDSACKKTMSFCERSAAIFTQRRVNEEKIASIPRENVSFLVFLQTLDNSQMLKPLRWNKAELDGITTFWQGLSYFEKEATEEKFKREAQNYDIIHLAMHTIIDLNRPMHSKLVFAQSPDGIEDNSLHAFELYNMSLDAQLAVLSSCNTGIGKLENGEGVMSIARAFAYAGCPSVVMSYWSVDDESTALLMQYFYRYLGEGFDKAEALRKAKLTYLDMAPAPKRNPYYWAGFVVMGDSSPITPKSRWPWHWWIGGLTTIAVIYLAYRRFRKQLR